MRSFSINQIWMVLLFIVSISSCEKDNETYPVISGILSVDINGVSHTLDVGNAHLVVDGEDLRTLSFGGFTDDGAEGDVLGFSFRWQGEPQPGVFSNGNSCDLATQKFCVSMTYTDRLSDGNFEYYLNDQSEIEHSVEFSRVEIQAGGRLVGTFSGELTNSSTGEGALIFSNGEFDFLIPE